MWFDLEGNQLQIAIEKKAAISMKLRMTRSWRRKKLPLKIVFQQMYCYVKVSRERSRPATFSGEITNRKLFVDCERETDEFLGVMELLGEKLGPLLLQFPYLSQEVMPNNDAFLDRLARYLERLPRSHRCAVEVRNRNWLAQPLLDLLRKHGVALALVDQVWMPTIAQLAEKLDVLTADFTYIRWIGDRKGIEKQTKTWDKIVVDREHETRI